MPRLSRRAQALLYYLVIERRSQSRLKLATLFWPDVSDTRALKNLRNVVPELRNILADYLLIEHDRIGFDVGKHYWLDVDQLRETFDKKNGQSNTIQPNTTQNFLGRLEFVERYGADFLDGFAIPNAPLFEEWLISRRQQLRQLVIDGLYEIAQDSFVKGNAEIGLRATRQLLNLEPFDEAVHRIQIQLLAVNQQRSAALAHFQQMQQLFLSELGVQPESETLALVDKIRSDAALSPASLRLETTTTAQPIASPLPQDDDIVVVVKNNLSGQRTSFIGREVEIAEICKTLFETEHRLITLTGLGGVGKSRLSLAVARTVIEREVKASRCGKMTHFPDGVWFVPLASLASSETVVDVLAVAITDALQFPLAGRVDPAEHLLNHLAKLRLLLILDNFEHLLVNSEFLITLLKRAPHIKLLVSSRHVLNLQAESIFQLEGLPVLSSEMSMSMTPDEMQRYAGILLFVARAQQIDPKFRLGRHNQTEVLRICQRVAGLPLAIELAAAMTRRFSCQAILQMLSHDYSNLTSTHLDIEPRHRSLTSVFDTSWEFLSSALRNVLAVCSLFPQPFTLEAATAVADATPELIFALVDASFLKPIEPDRFEMHQLVRHYALVHFRSDAQHEAYHRQRHADYFIAQLESDAGELLRSPAKFHWIQQELANLRIVLQWLTTQRRSSDLLQIGEALFIHFLLQGPVYDGWSLADTVLQMLKQTPIEQMSEIDQRLLCSTLAAQSLYSYYLGRYEEATQLAHESIALAQQLSELRMVAMTNRVMAFLAFAEGNLEQQAHYYHAAIESGRAAEAHYLVATSLSELGVMLTLQGKISEGMSVLHEGLQLLRQQQLVMLEGYLLSQLSTYYFLVGDWSLLGDTTQQALMLNQEMKSVNARGYLYDRMALFAEAVGEYEQAFEYTAQSLQFNVSINETSGQPGTLIVRGRTQVQMGDLTGAERTLQQAYALAKQINHVPELAKANIELGYLALEKESWYAALEHFSSAHAIATTTGVLYLAATQAGLAKISLHAGEFQQAMAYIEEIMPILLSQPFEAHYGIIRALLIGYQVLSVQQDPRLELILRRGADWLETQASKISDVTLRDSFLNRVPQHQQLFVLLRQHNPISQNK